MNPEDAYSIINSQFEPFSHQIECWKLIEEKERGFCLLSGTGSGKTEAVSIPSIFLDKRLVMVYPTRSLIEDQIRRLEEYSKRLVFKKDSVGEGPLSKTIAYDTGDRRFGDRITSFQDERSLKMIRGKLEFYQRRRRGSIEIIGPDGEPKKVDLKSIVDKIRDLIEAFPGFTISVNYAKASVEISTEEKAQFVKETSKMHLYHADVILTTLDMFLYRFFGYGERKWNLLYPYRLYMGKLARERLVVCFDEAHLYDTVSFTNFVNLVSTFVGSGIQVVVMSATLPERLLDMLNKRYSLIIIRGREISGTREFSFERRGDRRAIIRKLIESSSAERTIIVRNTVRQAFDTYRDLESISEDHLYLYHGRMFPRIRTRNYNILKDRDDEGKPYILVTTNAIEVGCDLDSTLLITDYCNPDQLLQRVGRCARKRNTKGTVVLLGTDFQISDDFLRMPDAYDYQSYHRLLNEGVFTSENVRATITPNLRREELADALFHFLYSYAYEFDVMRKELHDAGIVVTRSWIPSFTVYWVKERSAFAMIEESIGKSSMEKIIDHLRESDLLLDTSPLRIPIEYFILRQKENAMTWEQLRVVTVTDSSSPRGFSMRRTINPYMVELYLFFMDRTFPNNEPNLGLIKVPRFLTKKGGENIITVQASKKYFANSKIDRQIRYLNVT